YYIQNVQPGTYNLVISMIGFAKTTVQDVIVRLNETTTINAEIGEQAVQGEEVFVFADREVVRLEVSSSRTLVTAQQIENSPVNNLEEILSSYPGISLTAGADGTGLVIRGGNLNETNIVIDGLSTRDMRTQQPNTTLNLTAINQLEVISGGF